MSMSAGWRTVGLIYGTSIAGFVSSAASAAQLSGQVGGLVPPDDRPCAFFSLVGINEADPLRPGSPWIAAIRENVGHAGQCGNHKHRRSCMRWSRRACLCVFPPLAGVR